MLHVKLIVCTIIYQSTIDRDTVKPLHQTIKYREMITNTKSGLRVYNNYKKLNNILFFGHQYEIISLIIIIARFFSEFEI